MTSAPRQARTVSTCIGLVIAEVRPDAIAIVRNALLMPSRFGRPKLMFDAPHVVLTFSSPCRRRRSRITWTPPWLIAPIGITSGSTTMSLAGMPWSAARSTMRLGDREAYVGIFRDARLVVRDRDDRGTILLDQGKDRLHALLFAGYRVDQCLALVDGEPGLECRDDGGIDRQRHVGDRLNELDGLREDRRLVRERDTRVDVEHVRAGFDLRARIGLDAAEIAGAHLRGEELPPRRVDALADDDERPVEADDDFPGG